MSLSSRYSKSKIFGKEIGKIERFGEKDKFNKIQDLLAQRAEIEKEYYQKKAEVVKKQIAEEQKTSQHFFNIISGVNDPPNSKEIGVPNYWLRCFEGCSTFDYCITKRDKKALASLINIKLIATSNEYIIEYLFVKNEFFTNEVLQKKYLIEDNKGIQSLTSTKIDWVSDKSNLTLKLNRDGQPIPVCISFFRTFTDLNKEQIETVDEGSDSSDLDSMINNEYSDINEEYLSFLFMKDNFIPNSMKYFLKAIRNSKNKKKSKKGVETENESDSWEEFDDSSESLEA